MRVSSITRLRERSMAAAMAAIFSANSGSVRMVMVILAMMHLEVAALRLHRLLMQS
jgi:hypothetical protein